MGATIHKDVVVEPHAIVAAGSVVLEGTVVPSGQVFAGSPAKYLRDVTQEEKHQIAEHMIEMQQLSQIYNEETEKTFREKLNDMDDTIQKQSESRFHNSCVVWKLHELA
jgi:carbonic anhydrase/acetyltransferase-like protein (isoleucine patch superfamily)